MAIDYQQLLELMKGRRSVRKFRSEPVPRELVERLLEAARWAPTAGNRQGFRFLILQSPARIAALAAAVRTRIAALREAVRADAREQAGRYLENFAHFDTAPLVLAPIFRQGPDLLRASLESGAPRTERPSERDGLCSVSAAILCVLLASSALGLGACWMTGPLIATGELEGALAVPAGWSLAALIPVGFPAEQPTPPPRRTAAQLMRWLDEPSP
jgi:nitroreductase